MRKLKIDRASKMRVLTLGAVLLIVAGAWAVSADDRVEQGSSVDVEAVEPEVAVAEDVAAAPAVPVNREVPSDAGGQIWDMETPEGRAVFFDALRAEDPSALDRAREFVSGGACPPDSYCDGATIPPACKVTANPTCCCAGPTGCFTVPPGTPMLCP